MCAFLFVCLFVCLFDLRVALLSVRCFLFVFVLFGPFFVFAEAAIFIEPLIVFQNLS